MKKVLLFLLLFAAGVSVLRWIETPVAPIEDSEDSKLVPDSGPVQAREPERDAPPRADVGPGATKSMAGSVEPVTPGAASDPTTNAAGGSRTVVTVFGRFEYTELFPEGPNRGSRRYHLDAKDSRTLAGGEVELFDLTAVVYDEESGEEVVRIRAENARATIRQPTGTGLSGEAKVDENIALRGVECTLLRNAPISPLTLRAVELQGNLAKGDFATDGRVEIEGQGLDAAGTGFELRTATGFMRFDHTGSAEVELEPGRRATLQCDGELVIQETAPGSGRLALDASRNTVLELSGREDLRLLAQHLTIGGRSRSGDASSLGFERIDAEIDVELHMRGSEFLSDRAAITLTSGAAGRFRAQLEGDPRGTIEFVPDARASAGIDQPFAVSFRGAGPLVVQRAAELGFELPGPAELDWRGARLTARNSLSGTFGSGADDADFVALGDVVIVRSDGALETEEFRLEHARGPDGKPRVTASASGPARMEGEADAEHSFVLSTEETIHFALDGATWSVPSAAGVHLAVEGPRGFVASAERVVDFSEDPLLLEAQGGVKLDTVEGTVRGERLTIRGADQYVVEGSEDAPARFDSPRGEWVAARVELAGGLMIADDVSRASFEYRDGTYDLSCRRLLAEEREEMGADGVLTTGFRFTARDAVRGQAVTGDDLLEITCNVLEGSFARRERADVFLWSESSLHASGDVGGSLRRGATNFELTSDELSLERTDRGAEELSSGSVIARGNVNMTSLDGDISGSGDLLEVDRLGRGMLTADPGNRVRARGNFPGGRYPFDMTATWIQFSDVFLDAVDPEVEFDYLQAGVGGGVAKARGRADRLEATPESVELSGRIRLEGTDQEQNPWKLEADRARIDGANLAGRGILAGLRASGNVGFELGSTIRARGEEFSVRTTQRRVRIAGDPAYVEYEGMTFNSAWIEYDLLVHLLRAGKGRIEPNPK